MRTNNLDKITMFCMNGSPSEGNQFMTTPIERTLSVIDAREFLMDLATQQIPLSTEEIQTRAKALLRHYPSPTEILMAADLENRTGLGIQVFSSATFDKRVHIDQLG